MAQSQKYIRVMRFVTHYWLRAPWLFAAVASARLASTLIDVAIPWASGAVVDAVTTHARDETGPAVRALIIFVLLGGVFQGSRQAVTFLLNRMSARAIIAIGRDAFGKVQRFSADWHANSFAGATVRKITRGMGSFDSFTDTVVFGLAPAFIVLVGVTSVFAWRWPMLGAIVAVCIIGYLAVTISIALLWIRPANIIAREWDSRMSGVIADSIGGNQAVKSFAAEPREDRLFEHVSENWARASIVSWDRGAWNGLAQAAMAMILQICMLGVGLWLWTRNEASPGDIASLIATQFLIGGYLRDISQHVRSVQRTVNDMDDVLEFRDASVQVADARDAGELRVVGGRIAFDHATFKYAGASTPLFEDFSLEIPPGQRVGLVGTSGAGKSTFVKLVQRLYDLDGGRILIDGQDIAKVTQGSLRAAIGLVPQEPTLFHRSLADNIAYGRPGASMEEVVEAARLAHVDTFVAGLRKGYETLVGERGVKLSGGERQRVAIARAVLADTPILILDEATSSLDSISEAYIREAMDRLTAGRTTLIIAHRLSTVQRLDRILVFENGRIVEDGTHDDLSRRPDGVYRGLLETQVGGTLMADAAE